LIELPPYTAGPQSVPTGRNRPGPGGVIAQMRMVTATRGLAATAMALLLVACGGSKSNPGRGNSRTTTGRSAGNGTANGAAMPCIPTPIHHGAPPTWTAAAWSDSSPGFTVPYALASRNAAAAFLFSGALRAGHPTNPANKVLWVVRFPRDGHPLEITARLSTDPSQVVRISRPADSSPGEIYPSYVDLPTAGCWRLELAWDTHRASVEVQVRSAS
jgi:hypothetical protein